MKHILTIFIFLFASSVCWAKIWRVNNNLGINADFTTAQSAHDAATAGDTVMFEPSVTTYGNLTVTKKLIIFGVGFYLEVTNPNTPISKNSLLSSVSFNTGSSGSVISGIVAYPPGSITINTSNITIARVANFTIWLRNNITNATIRQNFNISVFVGDGNFAQPNYIVSNVIISNNFLYQVKVYEAQIGFLIGNNVINNDVNCGGQIFSNNILISGSNISLTNSTVSNNIDARLPASTGFGTTNGNIGNVSPLAIFVGGTVSGNTFNIGYDGDLMLKATSPAKGAGIGGVDCGIFGGSSPYVLSGVPPVPLLTKFVSSGIGSNTTPIQITISAKSNN